MGSFKSGRWPEIRWGARDFLSSAYDFSPLESWTSRIVFSTIQYRPLYSMLEMLIIIYHFGIAISLNCIVTGHLLRIRLVTYN